MKPISIKQELTIENQDRKPDTVADVSLTIIKTKDGNIELSQNRNGDPGDRQTIVLFCRPALVQLVLAVNTMVQELLYEENEEELQRFYGKYKR